MKLHYTLILLTAFAISFASCKKGDTAVSITGKWQETRIRYYEINANMLVRDTTYLAPFTDLDYVQFNANGTCIFSSDHYYYPNQSGYPTTPQLIPQSTDTIAYTSAGDGKYVFNQNQWLNYSGFILTDTAFVTGNTLRIQFINYGISSTDGHRDVTDSYYQR